MARHPGSHFIPPTHLLILECSMQVQKGTSCCTSHSGKVDRSPRENLSQKQREMNWCLFLAKYHRLLGLWETAGLEHWARSALRLSVCIQSMLVIHLTANQTMRKSKPRPQATCLLRSSSLLKANKNKSSGWVKNKTTAVHIKDCRKRPRL
jgi:hypothetical protein